MVIITKGIKVLLNKRKKETKRLNTKGIVVSNMAREEGGGGFQSAAGLMRYFDEEDEKGPKIDPRAVVAGILIMIIVLEIAKWQWPV